MNPTSVLGLAGLIVVGVIIADLIANPGGTGPVLGGLNSIIGTTLGGLLGKAPAPGQPVAGKKK